MKQYLIVISYYDNKAKQTIAMQDTQENAVQWVKNTLDIDNIESIVLQQFAIIETVKYEKDEKSDTDTQTDA